ncbi:MAG: hypothetical protein AAFZ80_14330 [Cyanobacteria bacterium P01_A01_bin.105]
MKHSPNLPEPDALDIALAEILGAGNSYAYSAIATVRRHLHSFRLTHQFEPHEILFDAYLRGKDAQRRGDIIRNPHAWLKSTAFNIIRENSRKARRRVVVPYEDNEYRSGTDKNLLDQLDLSHEIQLLYKALRAFEKENAATAQLLVWRTIDKMSWDEIEGELRATTAGDIPNQATLRQRVARGKKRVRHILHSFGLPMR